MLRAADILLDLLARERAAGGAEDGQYASGGAVAELVADHRAGDAAGNRADAVGFLGGPGDFPDRLPPAKNSARLPPLPAPPGPRRVAPNLPTPPPPAPRCP